MYILGNVESERLYIHMYIQGRGYEIKRNGETVYHRLKKYFSKLRYFRFFKIPIYP